MHIRTTKKTLRTSSICIPPDLRRRCYSASREMSLFSATPLAGVVIHCTDLCLFSFVWQDQFITAGHVGLALSTTTAGAATFPRDECSHASLCLLWLAAFFPLTRPSCHFILLSGFCLPTVNLWRFCCPLSFFDILWCPSLGYEFSFYTERLKVRLRVLTRPRAVVIAVTCSWIH